MHHEIEPEIADLQQLGTHWAEALQSRAHGDQARDAPMRVSIDKAMRGDEEKYIDKFMGDETQKCHVGIRQMNS